MVEPVSGIRNCNHDSFLTYCGTHNIVLCAECFFSDHKSCSDTKTLK